MTERQVQLITDFKPDVIMVTPSYMLAILDEFREQGLDPRKSSLRIGIFGAEPWTNAMREEIEEAFDLHAVDIYGLSGGDGPRRRQRMRRDQGRPAYLGRPLLSGGDRSRDRRRCFPTARQGELVFTSLTKEAMPVIRYRTRDLTRLLPGTARAMRRMEKVTGRTDDMMIIRGVNVFPTQIEEKLADHLPALSMHYLIVLSREGRMDEMQIQRGGAPGRDARGAQGCRQAAGAIDQGHHRHHSRVDAIRDPDGD